MNIGCMVRILKVLSICRTKRPASFIAMLIFNLPNFPVQRGVEAQAILSPLSGDILTKRPSSQEHNVEITWWPEKEGEYN